MALLSDGPLAASITFNPLTFNPAPLVVVPAPAARAGAQRAAASRWPPAQEEAPARAAGARGRRAGGVLAWADRGRRARGADQPARRWRSCNPRVHTKPVATLNTFTPGPHIDPTLQLLAAAPANLEYLPSVPVDWSVRPAFPDAEERPRAIASTCCSSRCRWAAWRCRWGWCGGPAASAGLLGSLLASAPAWRHIDPLPVVGRDEDEEKKWYDPKIATRRPTSWPSTTCSRARGRAVGCFARPNLTDAIACCRSLSPEVGGKASWSNGSSRSKPHRGRHSARRLLPVTER